MLILHPTTITPPSLHLLLIKLKCWLIYHSWQHPSVIIDQEMALTDQIYQIVRWLNREEYYRVKKCHLIFFDRNSFYQWSKWFKKKKASSWKSFARIFYQWAVDKVRAELISDAVSPVSWWESVLSVLYQHILLPPHTKLMSPD